MADNFDDSLFPFDPDDNTDDVADVASPPVEPPAAQTAPLPTLAPAPTVESRTSVEAPRLKDVGEMLASWARGRLHALQGFWRSHRTVMAAAAVVLIGVVVGSMLFYASIPRVPPKELVESYVREHPLAPTRASDGYATDEPLSLRTVEVVGTSPSTTRDDACDVQVATVYANDAVEARVEERLTYVRSGDSWDCLAAHSGHASHRAVTGVNQGLLTAHVDTLLEMADDEAQDVRLQDLYRDAEVEVVDEQFDLDEQTDTLSLRCTTQQGFASYACGLTALLRFSPEKGVWELAEVTASEGARTARLDSLVGTWGGTFVSQRSDLAQCLAARDAGLVVEISEATFAEDGSVFVAGTVSGIVHAHEAPLQDVTSSAGDHALEAAPFAGTGTPDGNTLSLTCDVQTDAATVLLYLDFGLAGDSDAAQATLVTSHTSEATFLFFAWDRTSTFTDTFSLERVTE